MIIPRIRIWLCTKRGLVWIFSLLTEWRILRLTETSFTSTRYLIALEGVGQCDELFPSVSGLLQQAWPLLPCGFNEQIIWNSSCSLPELLLYLYSLTHWALMSTYSSWVTRWVRHGPCAHGMHCWVISGNMPEHGASICSQTYALLKPPKLPTGPFSSGLRIKAQVLWASFGA